jgi:hypothetical protein
MVEALVTSPNNTINLDAQKRCFALLARSGYAEH